MQIEFTRHVFSTLTYSRDIEVLHRWQHCSSHFNRYIQKIRRLHSCSIEYFRVVEEHQDTFPHVHTLLQFPDARIRIENIKFFDQALYKKWKSLWPHGLSDYQKPKRSGSGTLSYLMKYLIKNQTSKTIWKKILNSGTAPTAFAEVTSDALLPETAQNMDVPVLHSTHLNGVKLASWSRKFDWRPFYPNISK